MCIRGHVPEAADKTSQLGSPAYLLSFRTYYYFSPRVLSFEAMTARRINHGRNAVGMTHRFTLVHLVSSH
eukprot:jgi/Botrbrau1/15815/Bobra.40_1s0004.1